MLFNKSSNPFFSGNKFLQRAEIVQNNSEVMTVRSTMNKFGLLLFLVMTTAVFTWGMFQRGVNVQGFVIGGAILGFIIAMVISFVPKISAYLAPIYALAEGVVIGGISALFNFTYKAINQGIITQAAFLTISIVLAMFLLYRFRIIKMTQKLRSTIIGAMVGIMVFYLIGMVLSFFGVGMTFFYGGGLLGMIISGVIIIVAALSLLLDFDMIEQGASQGLPKYMEWYAAFGLLITIVWIYMEVLRFIARLSSSNKN